MLKFQSKFHFYFNVTSAIIITVIGFLGNSLIIYLLSQEEFRRVTLFRFYIMSAISDSIYVFFIWPFNFQNAFGMNKNKFACRLYQYLQYLFYHLCSWIVVLTSIDRYVSVLHPRKFTLQNKLKYQLSAILIIFFVLALIDIPNYKFFDVYLDASNETVCDTLDQLNGLYLNIMNGILAAVIPFIIMIWCTYVISRYYISQKIQLKKTNQKLFKKEEKFARIMLIMDAIFLVLNMPFSIQVIIFNILTIKKIDAASSKFLIYDLTDAMTFIFSSFRIFFYIAFNKVIRIQVFKLFHKRISNTVVPGR